MPIMSLSLKRTQVRESKFIVSRVALDLNRVLSGQPGTLQGRGRRGEGGGGRGREESTTGWEEGGGRRKEGGGRRE
jgi:hypothetical protein